MHALIRRNTVTTDIMAHVNGWDILGREHFALKSDVLEAEEMGKGKN